MQTFKSSNHPGDTSAALIYGHDFVRPLGICMLPVMLFALVTVLSGGPALVYVYVGFPIAAALASLWTRYRMRHVIAEVSIDGPRAWVRSRADVALRTKPGLAQSVLDVKPKEYGADATIGLSSFAFDRQEWDRFELLVRTLRSAQHEHGEQVQARLDL